jgi:hypothetical protein
LVARSTGRLEVCAFFLGAGGEHAFVDRVAAKSDGVHALFPLAGDLGVARLALSGVVDVDARGLRCLGGVLGASEQRESGGGR